ncbi:MAG TPA: elongation factor Ts [Bacteroidetes bacterium]|nr:elongation factor Ts [Bacteroidota bacterium]
MATITAKDVNELRKATGSGMMDCKKALVEAEGNLEKAIDILRKKGQKVAEKRSGRDANEGAVFAFGSDTAAALVELNCETDFVARNEDFQEMGATIAELVLKANPATMEDLIALSMGESTIGESMTNAMGKIGEKISVGSYSVASADRVVTYIHPGARVGVSVAFTGVGSEDIATLGKDVAMQIAAMKPVAVDKDDVPAEIVEKEKEIARDKARAEGKPEAILDKIAMGTVNKYYKLHTLLNQDFVKDTSKTVRQYLKEANPDLKVKSFSRLQLGS